MTSGGSEKISSITWSKLVYPDIPAAVLMEQEPEPALFK